MQIKQMMNRTIVSAALAMTVLGATAGASQALTIDGTITAGEWAGATTATIGNGGGTAYFFADASYVYGAFDITGWTSAMGAASGGNLLGFGVWATNNGYPIDGVEFQQSTTQLAWGNDGNSGTMNGLVSAFRLDGQTPPAASIPGSLQAMDSFATGHRVWEVMMPISSMVIVGGTVWVVGGINFAGTQHWYPDTFLPNYSGYVSVSVSSVPLSGASVSDVPLPAAAPLFLTAMGGMGLLGWRKKRKGAAAIAA